MTDLSTLLKRIEITVQKANHPGFAESRTALSTEICSLIQQKEIFEIVCGNIGSWLEYFNLFWLSDWKNDEAVIDRIIKEIHTWMSKIMLLKGKSSHWERHITQFSRKQTELKPFFPSSYRSAFLRKVTEINHQRRSNQVRWKLALELIPAILAREYQSLKVQIETKKVAEKKALAEKKESAEKKVAESMMEISAQNRAKYEDQRIKNSQKWDLNAPGGYEAYLAEERRISHEAWSSDPFN